MEFGSTESVLETSDDFKTYETGIQDINIMITLLTQLYNDLTRIIVQEYAANARDAHREIHKDDVPIDITLPTKLSNELAIRDYGPGISPDRMANVFVNIGASTKRNDNMQTGGFGIGAKCAFCYQDSFSVDTFIDGIHRSYVFLKAGERGIPQMKEISEEDTIEPNGTLITINIFSRDIEAVQRNVYKITQFWEVRPNIINDEVYNGEKYFDYEVIDRGDNWAYYSNNKNGCFVAVDGISYRFDYNACYAGSNDDEKYKNILTEGSLCFFFKTGEVSISPNREGLFYDNPTIVKIRETVDAAIVGVTNNIEKYINGVSTLLEAKESLKKYSYLEKITGKLKWNNIELNDYRIDAKYYTISSYYTYRSKISSRPEYKLEIESYITYVLIDVDDSILSRVKTINISSSLGRYVFITPSKYNEDYSETEEEFNKVQEEYFKNNYLDTLPFKLLSSFDKWTSPKRIKVKGNIYKFLRNNHTPRYAWEMEDVEYDDVEGYYVEFERGMAKGFSLKTLDQLKSKYGLKIYGVPTRYMKRMVNNENMTLLSEFVEDKKSFFEDFIKENKRPIFCKSYLRNMNYQYEVDTIVKIPELREDCELFEYFRRYDACKEYSKRRVNETVFAEYSKFITMFGRSMDQELYCEELKFDELVPKIKEAYPLLKSTLNGYSLNQITLEHSRLYAKSVVSNKLKTKIKYPLVLVKSE